MVLVILKVAFALAYPGASDRAIDERAHVACYSVGLDAVCSEKADL